MDFDPMTDEALESWDWHDFSFFFFDVDLAIVTSVHLLLTLS